MEGTLGSFFSNRRQSFGIKSRKMTLSEKSSPIIKRPQLLRSVKGLVHRKTRSVGNMRGKKQTTKFSQVNFARDSQRSHSLDLPTEPPGFQKKGYTPGMDDYLTLAQLEDVWQTQGFTLGSPDVPQTASEYTFTYTEPVELGTFVKHQRVDDDVTNAPVTQGNDIPRVEGLRSRSQDPPRSTNKDHDSGICPPFALPSVVDRSRQRTASPCHKSKSEVVAQKPSTAQPPVAQNKAFPAPLSKSPPRSWTRFAASESSNEAVDRPALLDPAMIPNQRRPSTAPSHDSASSPPVSPDSPQRRPDRGRKSSRNEVVSGVMHPALRPTPYFSPRQQSTPGCRVVTSRYAVDIPPSTSLMPTKV